MEPLRRYLKTLDLSRQLTFAERCGTTLGYLRKVLSTRRRIGVSLAILIDKHSEGSVRAEELRPDVDWAYLRELRVGRCHPSPMAMNPAQCESAAGPKGRGSQKEKS